MATLVLSSVGGAVAGPMGAAVGSFFGRQIDRQSRQPGAARKLSDLRIQSAQYGAEIPAIFGRMRAAGTVVWEAIWSRRQGSASPVRSVRTASASP